MTLRTAVVGVRAPHRHRRMWAVLGLLCCGAARCGAIQVVPQTKTQEALDQLGVNTDVENLKSALCGPKCKDVWLDPTGKPKVNGDVEDTAECFALINQTCWDCRKEPPPPATFPEAVCTHAYFYTDPQPVSGHFLFCSGHSAASAATMSMTAWRRFIGWRSLTCHPPGVNANDGSEYDAIFAARGEPDAQNLRYYAAGTSGWQEGMEKQMRAQLKARGEWAPNAARLA